MAAITKEKHIHRYFKSHGKFKSVWKCADMDCNHFIWVSQQYTILSRGSRCWECGSIFPLSDEAMEEDRPRCNACRSGLGDLDFTAALSNIKVAE